jgi:hypothetical protein
LSRKWKRLSDRISATIIETIAESTGKRASAAAVASVAGLGRRSYCIFSLITLIASGRDYRRKSITIVRLVHTGCKVLKSAKTIIFPECFIDDSCNLQGKGISSISSAQEPRPVSLSTVHPRGEFVWEPTFIGQEGADRHLLGFLLCGRHDCGCGNSGNAPRTCARLRQDVKWA